ncbi:ATP-binding protein [Aquabacterium sp. J223]|uniref:ATP-binding protein n=1 Tax=Aquabacterium sp. J223 TaxID=2898431 RepID=UPI0021ADE14C|nr:ATP-binding protein [Aquabacterium sp. J223]UUX94904.1 response regulator [Aquabacterium sp. J223]
MPGPSLRDRHRHALRPLPGRAIAIALAGVVLAMGCRALLNPWLGDAVPFVLAFVALVVVQALAGGRAAVVLVLGCVLWSQALPVPRATALHALVFGAGALLFVAFLARVLALRERLPEEAAMPDTDGARSLQSLRWLMGAMLVLPAAFFGSVAWYAHHKALDDALGRLVATASTAQEHAARVVETNRLIAQQVTISLGELDDDAVRADEAAWHQRLRRLSEGLRQVQSVWVWNAEGRALLGSLFLPAPADLRVEDRDYFTACRDGSPDWFYSEPLTSRRTGDHVFNITRCRRSADGRFLGAVSVSLRPDHFLEFYRPLLQAEPGLRLRLLRDDGRVLVDSADAGTRPESAGLPAALTELAAGPRLVTRWREPDAGVVATVLQRVPDTPLVLAASLPRAAALAPWQRQLAVLALAIVPGALATAYVALVAMRRTRRELAAVARLRQESEQRGRAEQALRQAQKLEALGQLTGGVAHDFNNLLMVIHTNAYLLGRRDPTLADSRALQALQRAVVSGTQLTRQLLAFAKRQPLQPQVLRLQDSLPALADLLKTSVGGRVQLDIAVDPATPPVHVDAAELELALLNLAINARDAMPSGGRLSVSAAPRVGADGRPHAAVEVRDSGSGIPAELRDKVFEPFFSTKPAGHGTGLGLSQVWGFCEQAGGRVLLDSEPGRGTTVCLLLPAAAAADPAPPNTPAGARPALPHRVLMAEDNEDVAQATVQLLQSLGCEVRRVASADEGLALLEQAPEARPDLLLSDVVMPGRLNGVGLAREVRTRHPGLPVLLMTGYTQELQAAVREGFAVLPKPFDAETLTRALGEALARQS